MFSPYYAWARRRGTADPYRHVCLNVALYGRTKRWAMTERVGAALTQAEHSLTLGPSALRWDGESLVVSIDEVGAPLPRRIRGEVRLRPRALTKRSYWLDEAGRHRWSPISPLCDVTVALDAPALGWHGRGYLDSNEGDRPLEADFLRWDWCRAPMGDGAAILYDAERREGGARCLALQVETDGATTTFEPPPRAALPRTLWHVPRFIRSERPVQERERLEDAPFYARSVLEMWLLGRSVTAVQESLSLDRFGAPWVQAMLPFRMPRRWW